MRQFVWDVRPGRPSRAGGVGGVPDAVAGADGPGFEARDAAALLRRDLIVVPPAAEEHGPRRVDVGLEEELHRVPDVLVRVVHLPDRTPPQEVTHPPESRTCAFWLNRITHSIACM